MSTTWKPTVRKIVDNIDLVQGTDVINPILSTLADRDQYLFERIGSYDDRTVIMAYDIPVDASVGVSTVVYYKPSDQVGQRALYPALGGFQASVDPSHLTPSPSAFVFGIVKALSIDSPTTAEVYVQGLVPDLVLNDVLDTASKNDVASSSIPAYGPLYLSYQEVGKLSFHASAGCVYVGMFLGLKDASKGDFILAPNVDSLNQLFFNYRLYLHHAVAGTSVDNGSTHEITVSDFTKVGWVDAADAGTNYGYTVPAGAKFFYNVPSAAVIAADGTLTDLEKQDALLLKDAIPCSPTEYTMLFANGVLQLQKDAGHTNGTYIINGSGIWWFNDLEEYTPWPTGSVVELNLLLQATKLNPFYESTVVTSLRPFSTTANDSSKVITFADKDSKVPSTTGDLELKFDLPVLASAEQVNTATFIKAVAYDAVNGRLVATTGTGIVDVVAGPGLTATKTDGVVTVTLNNYFLSGDVQDIEPEEADFAYKGLHSYLRLKMPSVNQRIGFVGKFQLPQIIPANVPLRIRMLAAGESLTQTGINAQFKFEYSVSDAGAISTVIYKGRGGLDIPIGSFNPANTARWIDKDGNGDAYFEIPASALKTNAYVNFRICRVDQAYTSNIDVLGVNWIISNE